jgi:hypothetical protein
MARLCKQKGVEMLRAVSPDGLTQHVLYSYGSRLSKVRACSASSWGTWKVAEPWPLGVGEFKKQKDHYLAEGWTIVSEMGKAAA